MKKLCGIFFIFFLLKSSIAFSVDYAIFVPKSTQEDLSLFVKQINDLGIEKERFYLGSRLFNESDFDYFIEGGGGQNGRRALLRTVKQYKKVFVFESLCKFCSYSEYKNYISNISKLKILFNKYDSAATWPEFCKIPFEDNLEILKKRRDILKKVLKKENVEFIFLNLKPKIAIFIPKDFPLLPYCEVDSKSFFKRDFIANDEVFEELKLIILKKLKYLKKYELEDLENLDISFYQELCGDFAGRRKLFFDVKNEPYEFIIFSFENECRFKRKVPKNLLNSFSLEFCDDCEF